MEIPLVVFPKHGCSGWKLTPEERREPSVCPHFAMALSLLCACPLFQWPIFKGSIKVGKNIGG